MLLSSFDLSPVGFTVISAQVATSDDPAEEQKLSELMPSSIWEIITTVYDALT